MVGMPGFWARFDQIFGQIFGQVFDQDFWTGKHTVLQFYRDR